jgi:hypothetical protein
MLGHIQFRKAILKTFFKPGDPVYTRNNLVIDSASFWRLRSKSCAEIGFRVHKYLGY